ncbi:MAG: hypothetical protein ACKVQR_05860 [Aquabacterium sp.]
MPRAAAAEDADAPDPTALRPRATWLPDSYAQALGHWRGPADINAWIGERFAYDRPRALQLSESQRAQGGRIRIHEPAAFFAQPLGVCVDLARFAVETLRSVAPETRPAYLMIEFDPALVAGHTLRRHWLAQYQADGGHCFFADSRRPGHVAGPHADVQGFIDDYAAYRQRRIVGHRTLASYERETRVPASRTSRSDAARADGR